MEMVTIYTQEGCPLCERVKAHYGEGHYIERPVQGLLTGTDRNMDAMAQLAMQNLELPLILEAGQWITPRQLLQRVSVGSAA